MAGPPDEQDPVASSSEDVAHSSSNNKAVTLLKVDGVGADSPGQAVAKLQPLSKAVDAELATHPAESTASRAASDCGSADGGSGMVKAEDPSTAAATAAAAAAPAPVPAAASDCSGAAIDVGTSCKQHESEVDAGYATSSAGIGRQVSTEVLPEQSEVPLLTAPEALPPLKPLPEPQERPLPKPPLLPQQPLQEPSQSMLPGQASMSEQQQQQQQTLTTTGQGQGTSGQPRASRTLLLLGLATLLLLSAAAAAGVDLLARLLEFWRESGSALLRHECRATSWDGTN